MCDDLKSKINLAYSYTLEEFIKIYNKKRNYFAMKNDGNITRRNGGMAYVFYLAGSPRDFRQKLNTNHLNDDTNVFILNYGNRFGYSASTYNTPIHNGSAITKSHLLESAIKRYINCSYYKIYDQGCHLPASHHLRKFGSIFYYIYNKPIIVAKFPKNGFKWDVMEYDLLRFHANNLRYDKKNNNVYFMNHDKTNPILASLYLAK